MGRSAVSEQIERFAADVLPHLERVSVPA
jgi:hypothetical protein